MNRGGRAGIMSHIKISSDVTLFLGQVESKWICHDLYVMGTQICTVSYKLDGVAPMVTDPP